MRVWEQSSCLNFVRRTTEKDYTEFFKRGGRVFFTVVVYFYFQRMYTRYLTILIGGKREGNLWDLKEKF